MGVTLFLLAALAAPAAPPDSALSLRAVRFYRADPGQAPGITQVTAMLRIPASLPAAAASGEVTLFFRARVVGVGGVLYEQSWQKRTGLPFPRGEADRLDVLRFTLTSGSYRLEASVTDSVSGREVRATVPIEAYAAPPQASDLLLSPWLRPVVEADTIPQPGEFRRGRLILAIAPEVAIGDESASIAYLLETYSGAALSGALTLTIADSSGRELRRTDPTPVGVAAGIGLLTGQVEVADLPPGRYRLTARVALGSGSVAREAWFVVDPAAEAAPASLSDQAWFARLSGDELDQAFAPLAVIADAAELAAWPVRGRDDAKRAFLTRFWSARAPTPETGNERRARFYAGLAYAAAYYADPRRGLAGWRTDRGRIFLREGLPTQVVRREARAAVPAYEVWRYLDRGGRFYVFVDRGAAGVLLVRSSDPRERDDRRWQLLLTEEGLREVVGLLGRTVLEAKG